MGQKIKVKDFTTLTQWGAYMQGREMWIQDRVHKYYGERVKFLRMQGNNDLILHPDNKDGWAIRLIAARKHNGEEVPLMPGQFLICP